LKNIVKFEWDEAKNRINIRKRGIDFDDVREVFDGPMIVNPDDREDYSEDRRVGTGFLRNMPVIVVFTEINDTIRIISARKANRYERKKFEKEIRHRLGKTGEYDG